MQSDMTLCKYSVHHSIISYKASQVTTINQDHSGIAMEIHMKYPGRIQIQFNPHMAMGLTIHAHFQKVSPISMELPRF